MKHYIYKGEYQGNIVYIGKGIDLRYRHLNSGISSCYEANKIHFEGGVIDVEIIERFEKAQDALDREKGEKELIALLKPSWNSQIKGFKRKVRSDGSKGRGVQLKKGKVKKPWCAYVHRDNKKIHIGYYDTELEAEEARNAYLE